MDLESILRSYWQSVEKFVVYPKEYTSVAGLFGLYEELGELCRLFTRDMRDKEPLNRDKIILELGDAFFYLCMHKYRHIRECMNGNVASMYTALLNHTSVIDMEIMLQDMCNAMRVSVPEVLERNVAKLRSREKRGVLHGSGDDR